jgi:hypothetical protein
LNGATEGSTNLRIVIVTREWSDRGKHYLRIVIVTRPNKRR